MVGLKAGVKTPCRYDFEQPAALGEKSGLWAVFLKELGLERERSGAELEVPGKQTTN